MTTSLERYTGRFEQHPDRRPRALDALAVLALFGCAFLGAALGAPAAGRPDGGWPARLLLGIAGIAMLRCRSHPRAVVAVAGSCTMAVSAQGYLLTPLLLAPVMAVLYGLAALTDPKTTRVYGVTITAGLVITAVAADPTDHMVLLKTVGPVLWLLLPLAAGSRTRLHHAYVEAVQARAAHAELTREEEARLRVTEERMRIARELHDVVAHHLALANAQATTAAHLAPTSPEQTQKLLADLTGTTSSALRELKATVGLLRQANDPESAPLEPAPGLDSLPELISACRSAGLDVSVTTEGKRRPLSPGVDLTAYRILQEALTNVTKHAAAEAAHIRLEYAGTRLLITVTNDGTAPAAAPAQARGFGLMGMRERAHSVGGDLGAGPRPDGGFEVTTALPLHPHALEEEVTP